MYIIIKLHVDKMKSSEIDSGSRLLDVIEHAHVAVSKGLWHERRVWRQHGETKEHECSNQNRSIWAIAAKNL